MVLVLGRRVQPHVRKILADGSEQDSCLKIATSLDLRTRKLSTFPHLFYDGLTPLQMI